MQISLKIISEGPINNKTLLVQILAWHLAGILMCNSEKSNEFIPRLNGFNVSKTKSDV